MRKILKKYEKLLIATTKLPNYPKHFTIKLNLSKPNNNIKKKTSRKVIGYTRKTQFCRCVI